MTHIQTAIDKKKYLLVHFCLRSYCKGRRRCSSRMCLPSKGMQRWRKPWSQMFFSKIHFGDFSWFFSWFEMFFSSIHLWDFSWFLIFTKKFSKTSSELPCLLFACFSYLCVSLCHYQDWSKKVIDIGIDIPHTCAFYVESNWWILMIMGRCQLADARKMVWMSKPGGTEESLGGSAVWLERVTTGARNRQTMQQVAAKSLIKLYTLYIGLEFVFFSFILIGLDLTSSKILHFKLSPSFNWFPSGPVNYSSSQLVPKEIVPHLFRPLKIFVKQ